MQNGGFQNAIHITSGHFTSHKSFLPDDQYGVCLDNIVKGCSDMIVRNPEGEILIGRRNVHPQPDWWYIGGRIMPGESPAQSCSRLVTRELGLLIEAERFEPICCMSQVWGMREQAPQNHGTCDINLVLTVELTAEEADGLKLDAQEYHESKWTSAREVEEGDYHPALRYSAKSLRTHMKLKDLRAATDAGGDDAAVAALAREYVALLAPPELGETAYKIRSPEKGYEGKVSVALM
ncbi:hypothetical protein T484DRAFT_1943073 [Baffinella frigidus]|nr:hypothetical protein T484DRAFT_1943073 [Cryptophyta sp. CCMP2293]